MVVGEGVGGITHWQLASKGELAGDCVCVRLCWLRDDLSLDKAQKTKQGRHLHTVNRRRTQSSEHTHAEI